MSANDSSALPGSETAHSDFRVQTFLRGDNTARIVLTGTITGTEAETVCDADSVSMLAALALLWVKAGGTENPALARFLKFWCIVAHSPPQQPRRRSKTVPRTKGKR